MSPRGVMAGVVLAMLPGIAGAQTMPGMTMPADHPSANGRSPAARPSPPRRKARQSAVTAAPARSTSGTDKRGGEAPVGGGHDTAAHAMAMPAAGGGDMAGMTMASAQAEMSPSGTALPAGTAPPPAPPRDFYADRTYPGGAMDRSRAQMMHEQGGQTFYQLMVNLAEYQAHAGHDGYRWDGEAWVGGDLDRLVLHSEGTGTFRRNVDDAEVQALYSRAIGPYFDLQAGVRQDFAPHPTRTYATVGVEGLAPYMFQTEARLFVSTRGEVLARLEGWYDQRLTQRAVLQPRVELNLAAQDTPSRRLGSGLQDAELGLRLRYEVTRQFAPYVGVSWEGETGRTARYARADGHDPTTTSLVAGARFWF